MTVMDVVSVYDEFLEYLAQKAIQEEILAFKASDEAQHCADMFRGANKEGRLAYPSRGS